MCRFLDHLGMWQSFHWHQPNQTIKLCCTCNCLKCHFHMQVIWHHCTSHHCTGRTSYKRNANSTRLLCCGVSHDIDSSSSCSTAQSLVPVCIAGLKFSPAGSNCTDCTNIPHALSLLRCLYVLSTISLLVTVKLLHFSPVASHTMTFQLSQFIVAFLEIPGCIVTFERSR